MICQPVINTVLLYTTAGMHTLSQSINYNPTANRNQQKLNHWKCTGEIFSEKKHRWSRSSLKERTRKGLAQSLEGVFRNPRANEHEGLFNRFPLITYLLIFFHRPILSPFSSFEKELESQTEGERMNASFSNGRFGGRRGLRWVIRLDSSFFLIFIQREGN